MIESILSVDFHSEISSCGMDDNPVTDGLMIACSKQPSIFGAQIGLFEATKNQFICIRGSQVLIVCPHALVI